MRATRGIVLLTTVWLLARPSSTAAQVGFADPTFGAAGITLADFDLSGPGVDEAYAVAATPDGKVVAVGKAATNSSGCNRLAVAMILGNGSYDPTFGPNHDGRFTFEYPGSCHNAAFGVAIDDLGAFGYEIVVAANVQTPSVPSFPTRVAVLRLTANGTPDSLFGNHSPAGYQDVLIARGPTNNNASGTALAVDSLHRIFVAGDAQSPSDTQGFVIRLKTEGAPDGGFGNAGVSILGFGDGNSHVAGMALAGDGSIFLAGNTANHYQGLVKLGPQGSYSGFGHQYLPANGTPVINGVALDGTGKVLIFGSQSNAITTSGFVRRFNPDGSIDRIASFHYTGAPADSSTVEAMAVQADGRILLAGQRDIPLDQVSGLGAGVARLLPDLSLDPFFGNGGVILLDAAADGGTAIVPHAVALDGNARLLIAGMAYNLGATPNNFDMFVERMNVMPVNACQGIPTQACLLAGRFKVSVAFKPGNGPAGSAYLTPFGSDNSAIFYFFDGSNWELLLKTLDGCGLNQHFWVFYAATTNVQFTITVEDTLKHAVRTYSNPQGHVASPVADTSAFSCN